MGSWMLMRFFRGCVWRSCVGAVGLFGCRCPGHESEDVGTQMPQMRRGLRVFSNAMDMRSHDQRAANDSCPSSETREPYGYMWHICALSQCLFLRRLLEDMRGHIDVNSYSALHAH